MTDAASHDSPSTQPHAPLLVNVDEARRLLCVGRTTLFELVRRGQLTPVHIGRALRFRYADLEAYVDALHRR